MILVRFFNRTGCPPCTAVKSLILSGNKYRNVTVLNYTLGDDTEDDFINFNINSAPTVIIENNRSQVARYTLQAQIQSNYISKLESIGAELPTSKPTTQSPKPTGDDDDTTTEEGSSLIATGMKLTAAYLIGKQILKWIQKQ